MVYHYPRRLLQIRQQFQHALQSTCLLCGCRQDNEARHFGLCHACLHDLPRITCACRQCSIPLPIDQAICGECLGEPPAFDQTCCAVTYTGAMPALVHRFKTGHSNALRRLLADLLVAEIRHRQGSRPAVDIVIPVPMHWQRNLQRGNNHSRLLASAVAQALALPVEHHLLQRTLAAPAQKALDATQRRRNLQRAFRCNTDLTGRHIAVVDDVMTTGSTLQAIARTLKQAGAAGVQCWVVARTPKTG